MRCWKQSLARAIQLMGSQAKLARAIGCSPAKISSLTLTDKPVRAEDAIAIERATNGAVSAASLRPDLWPGATGESREGKDHCGGTISSRTSRPSGPGRCQERN
jgi:DNA-binding transcriptional regulator YdaS (Cro superfamily)